MTTAPEARSLPTSRKVLCAVYGVIAVAAWIATWSQAGPYVHSVSAFVVDFWSQTKATPASRFITGDLLMLGLAAAILMVIEARKYNVRFVWAYIVGALLIAISVTFPLFLIARELRMGATEEPRLPVSDTILLAVFGVGLAAMTVWVEWI
jgi:hypothetical protein